MKGILILSNNYTYEGTIEQNEPHGYGKFVYANGHTYEGHCVFGKADGYGIYNFSNVIRYTGYFSNGKLHGIGTFESDKVITKGTWRNDRRNGYAIKTNKITCKSFRQFWLRGVLKKEEPIQYVQPEALQTTKNNPIKRPKLYQTSFKGVEKLCIGCNDRSMNAAAVNCGHVCMCYECLSKCSDKCPICRAPVGQIIKLFVS